MDGSSPAGGRLSPGVAQPLCSSCPSLISYLTLHYLPLQHTRGCDTSWGMRESKDLLFSCSSVKTPTGISEPLNSTACCKWNCLLGSVRAGCSQLSLLTQLHKISPSCHPTLQHSLGPVLFPLKRWGEKMDSGLLHHLLLLNLGTLEKLAGSLKDEGSRSGTVLVQKILIYTVLAARDDLSPGSDFSVAHPSENQQIKTMEQLKVKINSRIWSLVGQTDKLSPALLLCAPVASLP